ncbi:PilN domain-containing protein [Marinobacterium marinum]|uniref:PilN domain-containing protein n=1 Tax=Marinobacterium marinum TaxID=2756129 RepID=A0A7W2ABJ9_9GAMM|nr:PilN domain-containing protein [Marinobacterium marinum]MBA4501552.1 PilN domain-containing protein [Marinobacterium marinum]
MMRTQAGRLLLVASRIKVFWSWWRTELEALIPAGWRRQLQSRVRRLTYTGDSFRFEQGGDKLQIETDRLAGHPALKSWQQQGRKRTPLLVVLARDQLLHRVIQLPAATEPRLASVLGFELDRHTPFSADQASYSYRIVHRNRAAQRIDVELFVLPNIRREQLLNVLQRAGLQPVWLIPEGCEVDTHLRNRLNLLPVAQRPPRPIQARWSLALLVVPILLLMLLFYRQEERLQALQDRVEPLRQQAEQAQAVREEARDLEQGWRFMYERHQAQISPLAVMNELTRLLPDNTWLNRLELENGEIQMQGESANASGLIGRLEGSALLESVGFTSPVTVNPRSGQERFGIRAQIVREVQP